MGSLPALDHDLLCRYDRPGPRYTSYPTALQFTEAFGEADLRRHIARSNADPIPRPLSLYVHVPYCFMPCFFCGCNRIITRDLRKGERYVEHLLLEIERVSPLFARDRDVLQVHLGGGTPNFLRPAQLGRLLSNLARNFCLDSRPDRDFSIELDPRFVERGDIQELAGFGLNRASLGVQDFDSDVQRAVNRLQSVEQTLAVIGACREHGFRSVNVDLIYGLPRQSVAGFSRTLDTVIEARPDRMAVYGYAHLPALFKAQRPLNATDLPDATTRLALLELAIGKLTAAGYLHIGLDHFALPDDDLALAQARGTLHRNFMGYTTHAECDLVGLGVSAISRIGDSYSQAPRDVAGWELALEGGRLPVWRGLELSEDDVIRADVIRQLMCNGRIEVRDVERRHGIDFQAYFQDSWQELEQLAGDGVVAVGESAIAATSRGRYLLRIIAMCFDRYLQPGRNPGRTATYSAAI
ncbi:MAG TPA: oxygen-independent coproporphyrinogen III oxidase [Woeseiaceae bacterium]|nr:oxygen-independent coproporphyrinogen III oxidase [Woeseiaceae bacterium]